jgi:glycine/D-amino acid oxidase-like deaminating enzyme
MQPGAVLWETVPGLGPLPRAPLPERADVCVIGAGYTGLAAARVLAQGGASVAVVERGTIGCGASGRNGGFVLPGYKADLSAIVARHGLAVARRLFEASLESIRFVEQLVAAEQIDCEWHRPGSLTLAAKPSHLEGLKAEQRLLRVEFGHPTSVLGPGEIGTEIGSRRYHGGLLDPVAGAVQPALYVHGLARAAARAGAVLCEGVPVSNLIRRGDRWTVETADGRLDAGEVVVATNGYSGTLVPWLARRVVPVGSFIVATAPLDPALAAALIPRRRVLSDTRNLLHYFRISSDHRLVFGGRAAFRPEALEESIRVLGRDLLGVFPQLAGTPLEFGWGGTLGFTLDQMPHAGQHDGMTFALGYGGHGVAMATWLGDQVGRALSGSGPWPVISTLPFAAVPLYSGRPWFLPAAGAYYQVKDWLF